MRTRTAVAAGLVAVVAAGSLSPALAAPKKKAPIKLSWTAQATPDPSSSNVRGTCAPTVPTGIHHHTFKVPAAGTLEISLNNTLDWSAAVRTEGGETLADADGGTPEVKEVISLKFKKAQTISIDTCNFAGELQIHPTGTFTFK